MYTLFIDTHSSFITVALVNEDELYLYEKESEMSHSKNLLPMIDKLLVDNNLLKEDIREIIAVNGPGSFTGLRIGLTVAKTWASFKNINIKTISTLKAYLISENTNCDKLCVIEDTKGYYISVYDKDNNIIEEEKYVDNLDNYSHYYKVKNVLDIKKIYSYKLEKVNPDSVKANYIKRIDAEK